MSDEDLIQQELSEVLINLEFAQAELSMLVDTDDLKEINKDVVTDLTTEIETLLESLLQVISKI